MGSISQTQIIASYEAARGVYAGKLSSDEAVVRLVQDHGMNQASATIYIHNLAVMLEGKALKRTMSAPSFALFLNRIRADYGDVAAGKAVASVRSNIAYWATLGRGNLRKVASICDAFEAELR